MSTKLVAPPPRWKPWRFCRDTQWKDRYGRIWFWSKGNHAWWRNEMSISDLLTFDPVSRPPRRYGPYTQSAVTIHPQQIIDLCPQTARLSQ